jgi:hypothetical protein
LTATSGDTQSDREGKAAFVHADGAIMIKTRGRQQLILSATSEVRACFSLGFGRLSGATLG